MEEALVRGAHGERRQPRVRRNPVTILAALLRRPFVFWVPFCPLYDRVYALSLFLTTHKRRPGRYLFNDRLVRFKCEGEFLEPLRQALSDKVFVKQYAEELLGVEYVPKTFAVLSTKEEVYNYAFPKECVVKPCHTCGNILFVRDGVVDKKLVASWLKLNYYRRSREQNYAFVKPKIIVEEFAFGPETIPNDYKVFCVDGVPKAVLVFLGRFTGMTRVFYDLQWNPQPYGLQYPLGTPEARPANLDQMLAVAATLAKGLSFVRVDLYTNGKSVKVGEITNCHGSANERFSPPEGERQLSTLLFGEER